GRHLAHLQQPGMKPSDPPPSVTEPRPQRRGGSGPSGKAASSARRLTACTALIGVGCVALYWAFWRPQEAKTPNGANDTAQEVPPWKPRPPLTPEELAKRPSPLDALKREAMELPGDAPAE